MSEKQTANSGNRTYTQLITMTLQLAEPNHAQARSSRCSGGNGTEAEERLTA